MAAFLLTCGLSGAMIAVTSLITYEILRVVWGMLPQMHLRSRVRVLLMLIPIFIVHILNIWLYAAVYFLLENYTALGRLTGSIATAGKTYESFIERLYFSASTYASLGLGDIVPGENLRMLASAEVLNGLVMLGWTISFTYLAMERFWSLPPHRHHSDARRT